MKRRRHSNHLLAALAMCAMAVSGNSQGSGAPFRDGKGRFSLVVPNGWVASPIGDGVQVKSGNALASVAVSDGRQDADRLLLSLGGQIAGQWSYFKEMEHGVASLGGQKAAFGVFGGRNPQGVQSMLRIVTTSTDRYSFALIMSAPAFEYIAKKPGFDAIESGFSTGSDAPPMAA